MGFSRFAKPARAGSLRGALVAGVALGILLPCAALAQTTSTQPLPDTGQTQAAGVAPATPASAGAPSRAAVAGASTQIEEVIVTAQKRAQSAQDVPIAITALSNEDVRAAGVTGTADLQTAVPALNMSTGVGGFGLPRIRGIGATGQGPGIENPVAVYVDGVYYGAAFGVLQSLFDVDQVAVLKGPQGTLFGRNATGGLIQISTLAPQHEFNGKAEVGYGSFQTASGAVFLTGGLSDTVAVSIAGQYEKRGDGFGRNIFTGNSVYDGKSWAGRAKVLWEPSDATSFLLSGDWNGRDASEPAFRQFSPNALGQVTPGGDYDINADVDPLLRARQWGASLTATQDLGFAELKSITAYRNSKLRTYFDPDGTTQPRIRVDNNNYDKQFSEEVNLVSQGEGPLQWVLGAFYMHDEAGNHPGRTTGLFTFGNNGYADDIYEIGLDSLAGFAELTYALSEDTHLIGGFRYTSDKRTLDYRKESYVGATGVLSTSNQRSDDVTFDSPSWRLSIDHRFSSALLVYASYNRGFRGGTFVPTATLSQALQPEEVDAYEIGLKSDLFDRRVRLNAAVYHYDQSKVQVQQVVAGVNNIYNANGAKIDGIDADATWQVTDHLRLFGGFSYTHARYKDFPGAVLSYPFPLPAGFVIPAGQTCLGTQGNPFTQLGGNCLLLGDNSGGTLQATPEWTGSLGGAYDVPTEAGTFTLAANYYYNDGYLGSVDGRVKQPSYDLVDASVTWRHPDDKLFVRLWGKNLTDAFYRTQLGATNSGDNGTAGAPRTYGVTLGVDF